MKKVTIKDVVKETRLSLGTISKYINGGHVKEKNRIIIEKAIKKLGYQVDTYARAMITKKTKTIGLVIPEFNNLFYASISQELEKSLDKYGYGLVVRESFYEKDREKQSIEWLLSRRTDAIVIAPVGREASEYDYLKQYSIPIIFIDRFIPNLNYEFLIVNNREISKETIKYLLDNGHRRILMVAANDGLYTADERVKGYIEAYKEKKIEYSEDLIIRLSEKVDDAYHSLKKILKTRNDFTAVFTSNYTCMIGLIFAINELKISIPDELSIVGFDDIVFTKIYRPKLTIVNQPIEKMMDTVTNRIIALLSEEEYKYQINSFDCTFVVNDSTKKIN